MDERDSLMRGSVFAAAGASVRGSGRSGLVLVILARWMRVALALVLSRRSAAAVRGRADRNFRAIQQLVESSHSNHFLGFNTLHGGHGSIRSAGGNRPHGSGLVAFNHVGKSALGVALNRWSGNQSRIVQRVDE